MVTHTISTSCNLDSWGLGAADTVNIVNGATVTVSTSVKAFLQNITLSGLSTLLFDGANASKPINMSLNQDISLEGGSKLQTTLGWVTLGTGNGTPNQVIDFKTLWSAGKTTDKPWNVNGVWVETGRLVNFVGGTHYEAPGDGDLLRVQTQRNIIYGPIESYDPGVNGTGSFVLKYLCGGTNILDAQKLEVCKVVDNQGPYYDITFEGTSVGTDTLSPGTYHPFVNLTSPATNTAVYTSGMGTDHNGFVFTSDTTSTQGTFGNGTSTGMIIPNGALVRHPKVHIGYGNDFTSSYYRNNSTYSWTGGAGGGIWDFNGVALTNTTIALNNGMKSLTHKYCVLDKFITWSNACVEDYSEENCIFPFHLDTSYSQAAPIGGTHNQSRCFFNVQSKNITHNYDIASGGFSMVGNTFMSKKATWDNQIVINGAVNLNLKKNIVSASYFTLSRCSNITIKDLITKNNYLTGTGLNPPSYLYSLSYSRGDIYFAGHENIGFNYIGAYNYITTSNSIHDSFKVRALGNPTYPLTYLTSAFMPGDYSTSLARIYLNGGTNYIPYQTLTAINMGVTGFPGSEALNVYADPIADETYFQTLGNNSIVRGCTGGTSSGFTTFSAPIRQSPINATGYCFRDAVAGTRAGWIVCDFIPRSPTVSEYTTGTFVHRLTSGIGSWCLLPQNETVIIEQSYYAKGHSTFTGSLTYADNSTTLGGTDWTGNVGVYFQYDLLSRGTGWNSDGWLSATTPTNWTNIGDIADGIKLKLKLQGTTAGTNMDGIIIHTNATIGTMNRKEYLIPIDQTTTVITLNNIIVGSRYWIYNNSTNTVLTSGVAASSTVTYNASNLADGTVIKVRVRYASTGTKYLPYEAYTTSSNLTASVYVSQTLDTIAT